VSLLTQVVPINVAADGSDLTTVRLGPCVLRMIRIEKGTLDTPDITITEQPINKSVLALTGLAADKDVIPTMLGGNGTGVDVVGAALPMPILERLQIVVAGAGVSTSGQITFLYEH
jgi:hypothetical protein